VKDQNTVSKSSRAFGGILAAAILVSAPAVANQAADGDGIFRVCADPNNLPFSNREGEGFENKLAELIAANFGEKLVYTWWAQRRGSIRNTLNAGACDVLMGVPLDLERVAVTRPYYRSAYVFVSGPGKPAVSSLKDPILRTLKVGVQLIGDDGFNTPPAHALAGQGVVNNVKGYPVYGDYRDRNPASRIVDAVRSGEVDVAAVWGPLAGYFAAAAEPRLTVSPVSDPNDFPPLRFVFDIAMGVRRDDQAMKARLNDVLERRKADIARLLEAYGVPCLSLETARPAAQRQEQE
jgi:mxaJ protein